MVQLRRRPGCQHGQLPRPAARAGLAAVLTMLIGALTVHWCQAQQQTGPTVSAKSPLPLSEFRPQSMLRVGATAITKAKFPVVDVHTHFRFKLRAGSAGLADFVDVMDRGNIAVCVSLDGRLGEDLAEHQRLLWTQYKRRFVIFVHLDWQGAAGDDDYAAWDCNQAGFANRVAAELVEAKRQGASGLKLFKSFGLAHRNADGSLVRIDDQKWDPIWRQCGQLQLPVILHTGDPAAFFQPIDATNERWEELDRHPEWSFYGDPFPTREALLEARNRVIARHPETIFIGAHLANNPEDLSAVSTWLDRYPNLYVEIASRIAELGRQPYTARDFFLKYSDRIMFGTDGPWPEARLRLYWRFMETKDEYFPYSEKPFPPQGFWRIYGLGLPDDVLRQVYFKNAARVIPGVRQRLQQQGIEIGS